MWALLRVVNDGFAVGCHFVDAGVHCRPIVRSLQQQDQAVTNSDGK